MVSELGFIEGVGGGVRALLGCYLGLAGLLSEPFYAAIRALLSLSMPFCAKA